MSGVVFLLLAVGISAVGILIIWLRTRNPTSWDSGISEFSRNMDALKQTNDGEPTRDRRRRKAS